MSMPAPTFVTGCARSGTSMVAGVIGLCGAFGGNMSGPNKNNEKGMFENAEIRNNLVKPWLRERGLDPLGQFPLPKIDCMNIPNDWKTRVEKVMMDEGYKEGPWFYKGAKACLMWPIWAHAFPDAKWIIVRRRSADIANSCINTSFMRAFQRESFRQQVGAADEREGWLWWVHEHEKRFVEMIEHGMNVKQVWPERMVQNDFSQMMETIDWLRLPWNNTALEFVSPKLWKTRRKQFELVDKPNRSVQAPANATDGG